MYTSTGACDISTLFGAEVIDMLLPCARSSPDLFTGMAGSNMGIQANEVVRA
jgi:hypothetical protein